MNSRKAVKTDFVRAEGCFLFDEIGGFAFEPGGSGSCFLRFPPKSLVENIARGVKQSGGLVVVNEITTGMGRTGEWFGFRHYDIESDIVSLGKGLGKGYPVSAVAMRREVAECLESSGFRHAQSHQDDPLGCAVAREVIAVLREEAYGTVVVFEDLYGNRWDLVQSQHPVSDQPTEKDS